MRLNSFYFIKFYLIKFLLKKKKTQGWWLTIAGIDSPRLTLFSSNPSAVTPLQLHKGDLCSHLGPGALMDSGLGLMLCHHLGILNHSEQGTPHFRVALALQVT